jgi:hypothetical protein
MPLPNELMLLSVVAIVGGLYCFIRGFHLLARKRLLVNTPTSKIRSASLGLVEVSGRATGPYSLTAPITGSPCYIYRTIAWRQDEESKTNEWKKVVEETLNVFFFLDDDTGQLLVNPASAELDLHCDFHQTYDQTWTSRLPDRATAFLDRHGISPGSNHFRLEEWTIRPNTALYIVGTVAERPGLGSASPHALDARTSGISNKGLSSPPEIVRLSKPGTSSVPGGTTQQAKIAAALHKAGITSAAAWQAAGVPGGNVTVEEAPRVSQVSVNGKEMPGSDEQSGFDLSSQVILMKGENNSTFLISWRSQGEVVRSMAWKSAAMVWCGAALALLGIYVLIQGGF